MLVAFVDVDILCINEENTVKKTIQVRCIAEIFAKAKRVLTWLGECEPPSTNKHRS